MGHLVYVKKKCKWKPITTILLDKFLCCLKNAACFPFDFTKPSLCTGTKTIMRNKIIKDYKSLKVEISILRFMPKISKFFSRNSVTNTNILKYMQ